MSDTSGYIGSLREKAIAEILVLAEQNTPMGIVEAPKATSPKLFKSLEVMGRKQNDVPAWMSNGAVDGFSDLADKFEAYTEIYRLKGTLNWRHQVMTTMYRCFANGEVLQLRAGLVGLGAMIVQWIAELDLQNDATQRGMS